MIKIGSKVSVKVNEDVRTLIGMVVGTYGYQSSFYDEQGMQNTELVMGYMVKINYVSLVGDNEEPYGSLCVLPCDPSCIEEL